MHLSLLLMCKLHRICHSLQWWYDYWPQTDHTAQAPSDRPAKKWHVWEKLDSTCFLITSPQKNWIHKCEAPTGFTQRASCKVNFWVDVTSWQVMLQLWGKRHPGARAAQEKHFRFGGRRHRLGYLTEWRHATPLSFPFYKMRIINAPPISAGC